MFAQIAWFLAPKRALCDQQFQVLRRHLPGFEARFLSGDDEVDKWSSQHLWDATLLNIRIVVSTPQIMLDALSNGYVQIDRLALIVVDEGKCLRLAPFTEEMVINPKPFSSPCGQEGPDRSYHYAICPAAHAARTSYSGAYCESCC